MNPKTQGRPVWIHGWGATTPLGPTWASSWPRLCAGDSAVGPIGHFDVTGFPCTVGAPVLSHLDAEDRRLPLMAAALADLEACAGLPVGGPSTGVFVGAESGRGRFHTLVEVARAAGGGKAFDHAAFAAGAGPLAPRLSPALLSPAAVAAALARAIGATGPTATLSLACASGLAAVIEAARAIAQGECDEALAGGVGADVDPLMMAGFGKLGALSARGRSRPFDAQRDGFVVGEGAALLWLSSRPGPLRLEGCARTVDGHHLTMPDPAGEGAERAMRRALEQADRRAVDHVQAHGTSTPLNDAVEAAALLRVLGDGAGWVSAVKGALGHWIAGAGAVGLCAAAEALRDGRAPPIAGLLHPDVPLPLVLGAAQVGPLRSALINAFAFGGANASVVIGHG